MMSRDGIATTVAEGTSGKCSQNLPAETKKAGTNQWSRLFAIAASVVA
jgi:hypothetical protein